ncbi:hypothetical protein [Pseudomonas sp. GM79]|nr:hypothetical protein [Pseudomonas sp. GM79]
MYTTNQNMVGPQAAMAIKTAKDTKKPGAITDTGFFKQEANRYSAST